MKFRIGDKVVTFFGNGTVMDFLQKEDINLYKVELSEGNHKGKMPWFAEHELNIIELVEFDWGDFEYDEETGEYVLREDLGLR